VLCVDKTGTLTMNKMSLKRFTPENEYLDFDKSISTEIGEKFHNMLDMEF